ncbi:MAG: bifunctional phosphoribosylaminoimidazolecarboxamide formyltransferase/IMP cyclohydrolase [Deinococcales bacterium]
MPLALLSVSNKAQLSPFAQHLSQLGYELISTGGTFKHLTEAGLKVTAVSDITQFPEILAGRVKSLHPHIHGAILAKREEAHLNELKKHQIRPIDLVVVNLYPFRQTLAKGSDLAEMLENIDIGGPSMLRSAAKNFPHVLVISDPKDYDRVAESLTEHKVDQTLRRELAAKAFNHTAAYDAAIANYLSLGQIFDESAIEIHKLGELRYGENPHQQASLWRIGQEQGAVIDAEILQGKEMSYNTYQDADAAWNLLSELKGPSAVAIKHANPCGVASQADLLSAYQTAHDADPVSIFGGIVAFNGLIDEALAKKLNETFLEIILAPDYSQEALEVFKSKKNLRLLKVKTMSSPRQRDMRRLRGGLLIQDMDEGNLDKADLRVVSQLQPSEKEWQDLRFAWTVCKHSKSNAIVLAKDGVSCKL